MVLNEHPLTNEPGYEMKTPAKIIDMYTIAISYKNVESAICRMVSREILPFEFNSFHSIMKKYFLEHYDRIYRNVSKYLEDHPKQVKYVFDEIYRGMEVNIDFQQLLQLLATTKEKIESKR